MASAPVHRGEVLATPWPGVHGTRLDSARHYARHWHADFGFGLLERGAQQSASGRGEVRAVAGDVITTNPGEVHDGRPVDGAARRWRMLYLAPDAVAAVLGTPAGGLAFTQPVHRERHRQTAIAALFRRLDAGPVRSGDAAARMACDEALARCCTALLAPAQPADDAPHAALRAVRERLADDPLAAPTLAELAAMAGCSRFQLLRRFAALYGLPPHAWLLQQRAENARRLIRDGARLADAATGAGFADQSHLTRCFVRLFGYTPGDWQRAAVRPPRLQ
ncbi:helix-turn-helix transcriptional regulator [Aquabacterium humicola]|uniref:helix-turn-helix transcriptional regulator n=1 Tax=Aquabacterium humicola TaxID=3237377 RepID=UPI002542E458|nr:AraC family transcriptional regulator [Rubrivivax pictus]